MDSGPGDVAAAQAEGPHPAPLPPVQQTALRILNAAAQSRAGLLRRLERRGYPSDAAVAAVDAMAALGYVDDAAMAATIAARRRRSGHGRHRIAAELVTRGVDGEAIDLALQGVSPEDERAAALEAGRRLCRREAAAADREAGRRRVAAGLQRRGFDAETIAWVLRQLGGDDAG